MKTLSKTILTVLATSVISCALLSQQAQATPVPLFTDNLAHLSANTSNSITIGDKVFNGFSFTENGLSGFDASGVIVTASFDAATGTYFLTYTGTFGALVGSGGSVADLLLNYTVTATAGQISMIDQQFTGGNAPAGSGFVTVDETAAFGGIVFGHSHLEINDFSDPPIEGDQLIIDPAQTILNVTKDIGYGLVATGLVSLSSVQQSFHQTVPDGGSAVALLGIALAGIEGARRIFRARKG
jgi:hypothetical protein